MSALDARSWKARAERAEAELERLRKALAFYATLKPFGKVAREALRTAEPKS